MYCQLPAWYKQQTGKKIRIIYQTFDINEVMLTKIERGHEDYDVVCPSEYIIERMLRKDLLLPIDTCFGKTPNYLKNVSPYIVEQIDATSNSQRIAHHYAVPYMWGTCGILYNKVHVPLKRCTDMGHAMKPEIPWKTADERLLPRLIRYSTHLGTPQGPGSRERWFQN